MRSQRLDTGARRRISRASFYLHLWFGVVATVALIVISITGILLNHKRGLGLMPEVEHEPAASFIQSVSLDSLARSALLASPAESRGGWTPADTTALQVIERMDVRPRNGFVKVRLRDEASTEMTVDLATGRVLHVGRRGDVFLEKLHSGEIFGPGWVLLSDIAGVGLMITLITGYWLWLAPKVLGMREDAEKSAGGMEE